MFAMIGLLRERWVQLPEQVRLRFAACAAAGFQARG